MTTASSGAQGSLVLDAEALYRELLRGVRSLREPHTRLAGIASGGAWLAQRLQQDLGLEGAGRALRPCTATILPSAAWRRAHRAALRCERRRHPGAGRCALHRPHRARCAQRASTTTAALRACAWPCWWTAAGASCPCSRLCRRRVTPLREPVAGAAQRRRQLCVPGQEA